MVLAFFGAGLDKTRCYHVFSLCFSDLRASWLKSCKSLWISCKPIVEALLANDVTWHFWWSLFWSPTTECSNYEISRGLRHVWGAVDMFFGGGWCGQRHSTDSTDSCRRFLLITSEFWYFIVVLKVIICLHLDCSAWIVLGSGLQEKSCRNSRINKKRHNLRILAHSLEATGTKHGFNEHDNHGDSPTCLVLH